MVQATEPVGKTSSARDKYLKKTPGTKHKIITIIIRHSVEMGRLRNVTRNTSLTLLSNILYIILEDYYLMILIKLFTINMALYI